MNVTIRPAQDSDFDSIWALFSTVIEQGDSLVYTPDLSCDDGKIHWFGPRRHTFVALNGSQLVGAYVIRPNLVGRGDHVANGCYIVDPKLRGQGIGKELGIHSIQMATELNFKAIQFNCVVSTNTQAIKLWTSLGFETIGTIPEGFHHPTQGYVDILIMYRPTQA